MACPPGFTLSFRGYYSCAVEKKPCATKRERPGMSASECAASCSSCAAVCVYGGRECWMYRELRGDRVYGADSVFCTRDWPLSSTFARLQEFRDVLTMESAGNARVVRSSGGAASGGVVSEGMGYGLLLAGIAAAAEERGSDSWRASLSFGEELFVGWRRMSLPTARARTTTRARYAAAGRSARARGRRAATRRACPRGASTSRSASRPGRAPPRTLTRTRCSGWCDMYAEVVLGIGLCLLWAYSPGAAGGGVRRGELVGLGGGGAVGL
jgi:hypothetical protein